MGDKSPIFIFVQNQYLLGRFSESHVQKYVQAGKITEEEAKEILALKPE